MLIFWGLSLSIVSVPPPYNPEHVVVFANLASLLSGEKRYGDAEEVARWR